MFLNLCLKEPNSDWNVDFNSFVKDFVTVIKCSNLNYNLVHSYDLMNQVEVLSSFFDLYRKSFSDELYIHISQFFNDVIGWIKIYFDDGSNHNIDLVTFLHVVEKTYTKNIY